MTHIWISHEHPDHLHFPTLKAIPAEQKSRITLLYQRHFSPRVFQALMNLGFRRVQELALARWLDLGGGVSILCCSVGTIDSLLAVKSATGTVLNVNDCMISPRLARATGRSIGPVDALLTQFSIASWAGNPEASQVAAADEVIERARLCIRVFNPKLTIPFASFVYFSHDDNRYMNAWINTPDLTAQRLSDAPTQLQFLYNGDSWLSQDGLCLHGDPIERYRADFQKIAALPYCTHPTYPRDELIEAGQKLVDEVRPCFPWLLLRKAAPVHFYVVDLDSTLAIRPLTPGR